MNIKHKILLAIFLSISSFGFAQDAALWLRYPSISPNGKSIVFNYMGDIYLTNSEGGMAKQLTTNTAYDYKATWSPDGETIAFASNRHGNFDIFTISPQGGQAKRITTNSTKEIPSAFSPDGKSILYTAHLQDDAKNAMFPKSYLGELYEVSVEGGRPVQVLSTPAEDARYNKDRSQIIYTDKKGGENEFRKHHTSSIARDIRAVDLKTGKHIFLSTFEGEDRQPIYNNSESAIFYLSEKSGSFNVWKLENENRTQISNFKNHPVRSLSITSDNTLCYTFHGELYTQKVGEKAQKLSISIINDYTKNKVEHLQKSSGASEMAISPNGKEVAFVVRGDVFVTSIDYNTTKRITNTPQMERNVAFSPKGDKVIYAGERNNSWNLYQTSIKNPEEKTFANSTLLVEEVILENKDETFRPKYSNNGKEVAYLANRTELQVINIKSKKTRVILDGKWNFSYTDEDLEFNWSPDDKWFLVDYNAMTRWPNSDIGLVDAQGNQTITDLTNSGYIDGGAQWVMGGKAMIWFSDRYGMRSHASWGSQNDVFAMFFTQQSFDRFNMSKEELAIQKELDKEKKDNKKDSDDKKKSDKKKKKEKEVKAIDIDLLDIEDRIERLTINSSKLSGAVLTLDGEKLYYLSKFEKGYDLWMHEFREGTTKKVLKLSGYSSNLQLSKDGKYLFLKSGSSLKRIQISNNKLKQISYRVNFDLNRDAEREYMFDHAWRQTLEKFYVEDMHGVDWEFYKKAYKKFLPHINNNFDFAEVLSELLGELNASHTGSGHWARIPNADVTSQLGVLFDLNNKGNGLLIAEVVDKTPLKKAKSKAKTGTIIEKIDGIEILAGMDYYPLLNHKKEKNVLLSFYNPSYKERWDEVIKPISSSRWSALLYERWIKQRVEETAKLSNGRIGYVHVKGMNDASFRTLYSEVMGRNNNKEAIIVDTRYNGGGHMHEDIEVLFSGKKYFDQTPRGHKIGEQPRKRWKKPSVMLVGEGNYSNAHGTPWVYKNMGLGKLVGMPVPGTMTSVWWETLLCGDMYFGIPQIGYADENGDYLENQQLEPNYKVLNEYDVVTKGNDQQLKKAVDVLLEELNK